MTLAANALTTFAQVQGDLGLPDDSLQAVVERQINAVSQAIQRYCGRFQYGFGFQPQLAEPIAVPTGITDPAQEGALTTNPVQTGVTRLVVSLTPIQLVASVAVDGDAYDPTMYFVEDADAGFIFNEYGWQSDPVAYIGTARDAVPGFDYPGTIVTYSGGYLLPQYGPAASWVASTGYVVGQVALDSNGAPWAVLNAGTSGGSAPSWPSPPTPGTTTVSDGTVLWLSLAAVPPTLPADLQEAAIIATSTVFLKRGTDRTIRQQRVDAMQTTMGVGEGGILPDDVLPMLEPYRRAV